MAVSATASDPRHYTAHDGRILPVGGTHVAGAECPTCCFIPTRPTGFAVGQKVLFSYGKRRGVEGIVSKVGRRYVTVLSTTKSGKRRESHRRAGEVVKAAAVRA